jgi:hypothetical protein
MRLKTNPKVGPDQIERKHFKKQKGIAKRKRIAATKRKAQRASRRGNR